MKKRISANPKHLPRGRARKDRLRMESIDRGYQKYERLFRRIGVRVMP